jgi:hypothetical protein
VAITRQVPMIRVPIIQRKYLSESTSVVQFCEEGGGGTTVVAGLLQAGLGGL